MESESALRICVVKAFAKFDRIRMKSQTENHKLWTNGQFSIRPGRTILEQNSAHKKTATLKSVSYTHLTLPTKA